MNVTKKDLENMYNTVCHAILYCQEKEPGNAMRGLVDVKAKIEQCMETSVRAVDPQDIQAVAKAINAEIIYADMVVPNGKVRIRLGKSQSERLAVLAIDTLINRGNKEAHSQDSMWGVDGGVSYLEWYAGLSAPWKAVIRACHKANPYQGGSK